MISLKQYYFDKFKWSLMALASSSCVQKNLLPENSMVGEEIVLEYEEAVGENLERIHEYIDITEKQLVLLRDLDAYISGKSGEKYAYLWLENSSLDDSEWQEIRSLAMGVILAFHWEMETPKALYSEVINVNEHDNFI
jgi:hypothetical protein